MMLRKTDTLQGSVVVCLFCVFDVFYLVCFELIAR